MYRRSWNFVLRSVATLIAAVYILLCPAGSVNAQLSPQEVSQFLANPSAILTANPNGGAQLVSTVRDLLLSDSTTLPVLISLLANANAAQQSSMGSGFGQAVVAVQQSNSTFATQIQEALAASGVQIAIASYSAVTGNTVTAATGAGGAGGGVGGPTGGGLPTGGGGGSGGGSTGTSGSSSTGGGLTGGVGGVSGSSGSSDTTTTSTLAQSTSPQ